ncbi:MAG TPA: glycoside hydrolase [Anaerohalosphaeraceae bacterium]|nr:glycoside hydrolase [Anaerohalosphaeraceae bacterium]
MTGIFRYIIAMSILLCAAVGHARQLPVRFGLQLHLAADQIAGLSDGQTISSWSDLSGKGRHAVQTAESARPVYKSHVLNDLPAVRFDGIDDYLTVPEVTGIRTVFLVFKEDANATASNRSILGHSSATCFHRGWPRQIWSDMYTDSEVKNGITKINREIVDGKAVNVPTDFVILSVATTGATRVNQITRDRWFGERVWDGDIAEIILYSRLLTAAEEDEVGAYLQEKYGIDAGYPSSEAGAYVRCVPAGTGGLNLFSSSAPQLTVTVDVQTMHQKMQSFGASDCWSIQYVGNWPSTKTNGIADLLFSKDLDYNNKPRGIGLSLWRVNLGAGSARQSNIYDAWRRADCYFNSNFSGYDWTRCSGQRSFLQKARARGVEHFLAFSNSPPINMTKNGNAFCDSSVGTTNLADDQYDDFANYLATVVERFRTVEGIDFDSISPINEPQWDWNDDSGRPGYSSQEGCRYSSSNIKTLVDALSAALVSRGLKTQIEICESGELQDLNKYRWYDLNYIYDFFNTSSSRFIGYNSNVRGTISSHSYWSDSAGQVTSVRQSLANTLTNYNLGYAQTEFCILGDYGPGRDLGIDPALWIARVIHTDLAVGEAQSWQWWLGVSPYDYKDGLIYCDYNTTDGNYYPSKMLWAMGNYSRFIRPGMYRVDVRRSDNKTPADVENDLMVSGYYSFAHHAAVLVFVNYASEIRVVKAQFVNLPAGKTVDYMVPYVTAGNVIASDSLTPYQALSPGDVFRIPARSVVTVVGLQDIPGDINRDRRVDSMDLSILTGNWLNTNCGTCNRADLDNNHRVDIQDFAQLATNWLFGMI